MKISGKNISTITKTHALLEASKEDGLEENA
jgi:hypothetical protein